MKKILTILTILIIVGCDDNKQIVHQAYCWMNDEINFFIEEEKARDVSEIDFNRMKDIFVEDKSHITLVEVNNNIDSLDFFVINQDLILRFYDDKLIILEEKNTPKCWE